METWTIYISIHVPELLSIFNPKLLKVEVLSQEVKSFEPRHMFAKGTCASLTKCVDVETQLKTLARLEVFHQLCPSLALEVFLYDTTRTTIKSIPNSNLLATGDYMVNSLN